MNWLTRRAEAYRIVFLQVGDKPAGFWARLHSFGVPTPPGQQVLADLAWRCCAYETTARFDNNGRLDPIHSAKMEGRREVFLIIQSMLNLDPSTLLQNEEAPNE